MTAVRLSPSGEEVEVGGAGPAGGDLSGSYPDPQVVALTDGSTVRLVFGTLDDGGYLMRSGSAILTDTQVITASTFLGGDLTGNLPNPDVVAIHSGAIRLPIDTLNNNELMLRRSGAISSIAYGSAVNVNGAASDPGDAPGPSRSNHVHRVTGFFDGTTALSYSTVTDGGFLMRSGSNVSAAARPVVTGSRASGAALANLLTELGNIGLITDSTTA